MADENIQQQEFTLDLSSLSACEGKIVALLSEENVKSALLSEENVKSALPGIFSQLMTAATADDDSPQKQTARRLLDVLGLYVMTNSGEEKAFHGTVLSDVVASAYNLLPEGENALVKKYFALNNGKLERNETAEPTADLSNAFGAGEDSLLGNDALVEQFCFHGVNLNSLLQGVNIGQLPQMAAQLSKNSALSKLIQSGDNQSPMIQELLYFLNPQGTVPAIPEEKANTPAYTADNILIADKPIDLSSFKNFSDFQDLLAGALHQINTAESDVERQTLFKRLYANAMRLSKFAPTKELKQTADDVLGLLDGLYREKFKDAGEQSLQNDDEVQQHATLKWWESLVAGIVQLLWPILGWFMPDLKKTLDGFGGGLSGIIGNLVGDQLPQLSLNPEKIPEVLKVKDDVKQAVFNLLQTHLSGENANNPNYTELTRGLIERLGMGDKTQWASVGAGILQYLNTKGANKQAVYNIFQTLKTDDLTKEQVKKYPWLESLLFVNSDMQSPDDETKNQIMQGVIQGMADVNGNQNQALTDALNQGFKGDNINLGALFPVLGQLKNPSPQNMGTVLSWLKEKGSDSPEIKNIWITLEVGKALLNDKSEHQQQLQKIETILTHLGYEKPENIDKKAFYENLFSMIGNKRSISVHDTSREFQNFYNVLNNTFLEDCFENPIQNKIQERIDKLLDNINDADTKPDVIVKAFLKFAQQATPLQCVCFKAYLEQNYAQQMKENPVLSALTSVLGEKAQGTRVPVWWSVALWMSSSKPTEKEKNAKSKLMTFFTSGTFLDTLATTTSSVSQGQVSDNTPIGNVSETALADAGTTFESINVDMPQPAAQPQEVKAQPSADSSHTV